MHAVPLFLPRMHQSRAHLVSDGLASPQDVFLLLSIPLPLGHSSWVQASAAYWGGVQQSRGLGCFFLLWICSRDEHRVPNAALVAGMLGEPARPQHPAAGFT